MEPEPPSATETVASPGRPIGCFVVLGLLATAVCAFAAMTIGGRVAAQAGGARVGRLEEFPPGAVKPLWFNGETISTEATGRPAVIWLVHGEFGLLALYRVGPEQQGKAPPGAEVAGLPQPPHACGVEWRAFEREFLDPCSGSRFDAQGRVISGSSPRGLDRFRVSVSGDYVVIDGRRVEPGPPR
jgi:hypothetical protein